MPAVPATFTAEQKVSPLNPLDSLNRAATSSHRSWADALAVCLVLGVAGCANAPVTGVAGAAADPAAPGVCRAKDEVAFACTVKGGALLALCASPGFGAFDGPKESNPGHAYLALASQDRASVQRYPADPKDYRRHLLLGFPTSGVPYLYAVSEAGEFLQISQSLVASAPKEAVGMLKHNLPPGWAALAQAGPAPCEALLEFKRFDAVSSRLPLPSSLRAPAAPSAR